MRRFLKLTLIFLISVLILVIAAVFLAVWLIDPNDHKQRIAALITTHTGRNFHLDGEIQLKFFPWLGLDLGRVTLDNPPDFTETVFARADKTQVDVKVLPLLGGKVEMGKVVLEGLTVNLIRKATGQNNWQDLINRFAAADAAESSEKPLPPLELQGVDIRQANLRWQDLQAGASYQAADLNLSLSGGAILQGVPLDLKIAARLDKSGEQALTAKIELQAQLKADPMRYAVNNLQGTAQLSGTSLPPLPPFSFTLPSLSLEHSEMQGDFQLASGDLQETLKHLNLNYSMLEPNQATLSLQWSTQDFIAWQARFAARYGQASVEVPEIKFNLAEQNVDIPQFQFKILETTADLAVKIEHLFENPKAIGELSAEAADVQRLLTAFGLSLLPGDQIPQHFSLQTKFAGDSQSGFTLKPFALQADNHELHIAQLQFLPLKNQLTIENLTASIEKTAHLHAEAKLDLNPPLNVQASFQVSPFNFFALWKKWALPPLSTADAAVLQKLALNAVVDFTSPRLTLKKIQAQIDDAALEGSAVIDLAQPAYQFELALNQAQLDRYLPPPAPAKKSSAPPALPALPLEFLQTLPLNGTLKIGKLEALAIKMRDATISLTHSQNH